MTPAVAVWQAEAAWRRLSDYLALTKPRVVAMVLVTTAVGFHLGSAGSPLFLPLLYTLAGTALSAGGTLALNQYMERDVDAQMDRTRHRPLPEGRDLLYQLTDFATQPKFVFEHRWTVGDLVMWDNRSTMHRARPYFPETATRDMHRTSIDDVASTLDQAN